MCLKKKRSCTAVLITIKYTGFSLSCLLPLASCLLPLPCSLFPKTKEFLLD
ncbi:MAG: hypothetical protein F6K65_01120 [Moorea sp. SIO3C2]|nr:hypothetical protein [Moorena sp. SIO3C2]